jgi:hypothetical protein
VRWRSSIAERDLARRILPTSLAVLARLKHNMSTRHSGADRHHRRGRHSSPKAARLPSRRPATTESIGDALSESVYTLARTKRLLVVEDTHGSAPASSS